MTAESTASARGTPETAGAGPRPGSHGRRWMAAGVKMQGFRRVFIAAGAEQEERPPSRWLPAWLFLMLFSVYTLSIGGAAYSADGHFGFEMAKSFVLDPTHEYYQRFRTGFIRWGILSPVLAQPFMFAGDFLASRAPQRDDLVVDGHRYRLESWPVVGQSPADQRTYRVTLPRPVLADSVHIISFLSNAVDVREGETVATLRLVGPGGGAVSLPIEAGRHTAEWAWERGDVRRRVGHPQARAVGRWIGAPVGRYYSGVLPVSPPALSASLEVTFTGSAGAFHTMALVVSDASSGALVDVRTDDRLWSKRQNRDTFLRLAYALVPAVAAAAAGVLVYVLVRGLAYTAGVSLVVALGYGLGTMAWPYAKLDFTEPLATAFVLLAVVLLAEAYRRVAAEQAAVPYAAGAGVALVAAIATKYVAALFVPLLGLHGLVLATTFPPGHRWFWAKRLMWAYLAPIVVLGLLGLVGSIVVAREPPVLLTQFVGGVMRGWLGLPPWIGFRGLLLSSGKSVLLYSPFLVVTLLTVPFFLYRHGRKGLLYVAVPLLFVAVYSFKRAWDGGGWGPRYLVPMLPFLVIVASPLLAGVLRRAPKLVLALFVLAIPIQLLGVAKDFNAYAAMYRQHIYPQLPDAGASLGAQDFLEFLDAPALGRSLQTPPTEPAGGPARQIGYLYGEERLEMQIAFRQPRTTWLTLYAVDFDRQARRQTIHLRDARGERTYELDASFEEGVWLSWLVAGQPGQPVGITVIQEGHDVAALSALTFDPPPAAAEWTTAPQADWTTQGRWLGRYGDDGFMLFAWRGDHSDVQALPPYVASYQGGERVNLVTTEDAAAEAGLLYALPFSPVLAHAWLLAGDAVQTLWPGRPDLLELVLSASPWRWWGLDIEVPHPEYGLGLDLWPARLYDNYSSHPQLIAVVLAALFVIEGMLVLATVLLWRGLKGPHWAQAGWPRLTVAALVTMIGVYNIAQFGG